MEEFIKNNPENSAFATAPLPSDKPSELENSHIVLQIPFKDYTLTDIARIVESNNAHVVRLAALPVAGGSELQITIGLNVSDITAVLRSFERFNYTVTDYYMKENEMTDTHKERLDELLYYLRM